MANEIDETVSPEELAVLDKIDVERFFDIDHNALMDGLLRCGSCGSAMWAVDENYVCERQLKYVVLDESDLEDPCPCGSPELFGECCAPKLES